MENYRRTHNYICLKQCLSPFNPIEPGIHHSSYSQCFLAISLTYSNQMVLSLEHPPVHHPLKDLVPTQNVPPLSVFPTVFPHCTPRESNASNTTVGVI
eukprot:9341421-Pyramimonas_sp.AAC.1